MDNLTHTLVGALIGQAGLKRRTGLAMPALIIGANIPDIDASCVVFGPQSLAMRRGLTHGPLAMIALPLALAAILYLFDRWQIRRGTRPRGRLPVRFGWLWGLAFIACLGHPALDWLNTYGIRLLAPFSQRWFYGDTLFIVDWVLWIGMGLAFFQSWLRERRGLGAGGRDWRAPARRGLAFLGIYILANGVLTGLAQRAATHLAPQPQFAIASPAMGQPWKREVIFTDASQRWYEVGWTPLGFDGDPLLLDPDQCAVPVERLRRTPALDAFLFWSRAPIFVRQPNGAAGGEIVLRDARFYDPAVRSRFTVPLPGEVCARPPAP